MADRPCCRHQGLNVQALPDPGTASVKRVSSSLSERLLSARHCPRRRPKHAETPALLHLNSPVLKVCSVAPPAGSQRCFQGIHRVSTTSQQQPRSPGAVLTSVRGGATGGRRVLGTSTGGPELWRPPRGLSAQARGNLTQSPGRRCGQCLHGRGLGRSLRTVLRGEVGRPAARWRLGETHWRCFESQAHPAAVLEENCSPRSSPVWPRSPDGSPALRPSVGPPGRVCRGQTTGQPGTGGSRDKATASEGPVLRPALPQPSGPGGSLAP